MYWKNVKVFSSRAFVALILLGSLGLQTLCLNAQAGEEIYNVYRTEILNPPPIINQTKTWEGLWTLDVKTLPLFDTVSPELKYYHDVRFTPNPELFEFTGEVTQYSKKHTPSLLLKFTNTEAYKKCLAQVQKETSKGQEIKNGFKTLGTSIISVPGMLISIALFPTIIFTVPAIYLGAVIIEGVKGSAKGRKYILNRKKALLRYLESPQVVTDILPLLQKSNALQQDYSDPLQNKRLLTYHVLPWILDYDLNIKDYVEDYFFNNDEGTRSYDTDLEPSEVLSFGLKLKKEMSLEDFEALLAKEFTRDPNNSFSTYISDISLTEASSKKSPVPIVLNQDYITNCTLRLKADFRSFNLRCYGYKVQNN